MSQKVLKQYTTKRCNTQIITNTLLFQSVVLHDILIKQNKTF